MQNICSSQNLCKIKLAHKNHQQATAKKKAVVAKHAKAVAVATKKIVTLTKAYEKAESEVNKQAKQTRELTATRARNMKNKTHTIC